ncbi:peptide deformylase [Pyramidobacter sp. YE332]|uniref:peptide deformylase n=1 Tax=Pyramidobacter sp. YE332 TaxID=3068894 RepID=UPI00294ABD5F|nr:peptide deformylase [Pyramidobacter sp. YE332]WOL38901.1 peptide deformylase [Pyramidobacter sp. YE332]
MQLKIVEFPDPVLRRATRPVTVFDEALKVFVDEMTIVMKDDDGVGIAAPQVGVSKKVAVVCFEGERYVLVNPVIVEATGTQRGEEGCLSFPGIFGEVERAERVVVECQDETGARRRHEAKGFVARAFQHEIEHLEGKLLIDHFSPMKRELIRKRLMKRK